MIYHKKAMLFLALSVIGQADCACSSITKRVVAGGSAIGAIALAGKLFALRRETAEIMKDPNAKQALEMLNRSSACTITFGFYDYSVPSDWLTIREEETRDINAKEAYELTTGLTACYGDGAVLNLRVCSGDSCVNVPNITRRVRLEPFLRRVDSAEAPILGRIHAPAVRRLINRIIRP